MERSALSTVARRTGIATLGTILFTLALTGVSHATTDPVVDGFNEAESKVTTYGGAMILLVLVGLAIALGIKYLGKGFRKA